MFVRTVSANQCLSIAEHFLSSHDARAYKKQEDRVPCVTDCRWMSRLRLKVKRIVTSGYDITHEMKNGRGISGGAIFVFPFVSQFCFCNNFQN